MIMIKKCTRCSNESRPNKTLCEECKNIQNFRGKLQYQKLKREKRCRRCGLTAKGDTSRCEKCKNADVINNHKRNREIKNLVFSKYGGYTCVCCGITGEFFVGIDHIDRKFKKETGTGYKLYRWLLNNNFPEGFRVLCHTCNLATFLNKGICPHKLDPLLNL